MLSNKKQRKRKQNKSIKYKIYKDPRQKNVNYVKICQGKNMNDKRVKCFPLQDWTVNAKDMPKLRLNFVFVYSKKVSLLILIEKKPREDIFRETEIKGNYSLKTKIMQYNFEVFRTP